MKLSDNDNQYRLRRGREADRDMGTSPVLVAGCTVFFLSLLGTTATILTLVVKQADLRRPLCFALRIVIVLFKQLDHFAILVG